MADSEGSFPAEDRFDVDARPDSDKTEASRSAPPEPHAEPPRLEGDRDPDYAELELNFMDQFRRETRALLEHSRTVKAEHDPWGHVPTELRDLAKTLQKRLDALIITGYDRYVRPAHGNDNEDQAWRRFVRWREDMQERYSRRAFGDRFDELLGQGVYLTVPQDFDEDVKLRESFSKMELADAVESGALPRRAPILDPIRRRDDLQLIGPPYAQRYRDALRKCGWRCVFHVTRPEHLWSIGVYGLMPGREAVQHSTKPVERGSRTQGNPTKEQFAANSVCSSFFPQYWTFESLGGEQNSVIVAIDAEVVCLRRGSIFFPEATRSTAISIEDHNRNRNDTPEGFAAFMACWNQERPLADGWGPKPDNHEIHSQRILPNEIEALVFRTRESRDEWFPAYLRAAQENYDDVTTEASVERIRLGRRTFEFPSVREARTRE